MTIEEKANRIIEDIRNEKGVNPINMFKIMAKKRLHKYTWARTSYIRRGMSLDGLL